MTICAILLRSLTQEISRYRSPENGKGFGVFALGDYRVICEIDDGRLVILVIKVGHRKEIYN